MDSRVPFIKNDKGEIFALGRRYKDLATAEKETDKIIAQREAVAGRPLTARELREGLVRTDTRSEREKIADRQWQPKLARQPKEDDNPFRGWEETDEDLTPRQKIMRAGEAAWDAKKEKERDRTSPARKAAIAEAEAIAEAMAYDPAATAADVERAGNLVTQAKVGDLQHYRTMLAEINGSRAAAIESELTKVNDDLARRQAEAANLSSRLATLRPQQQPEPQQQPATPEPPANKYVRINYSEAAGGGSAILEFDAATCDLVAKHDPATCDAAIIAAATD